MEKIDDYLSLFNQEDYHFLNLTPLERANCPPVFDGYNFLNSESILESVIGYSYENLGFAAKIFLNVDLLPYQIVTLHQLFNHQFPMLIGARGFGKCVKDCYIMTNDGIKYINDMFSNEDSPMTQIKSKEKVFGENGFKKVAYKWKNIPSKLKKIETSNGYSLSCTYNHPIRVVRDDKILWINSEDVKISDYIPIDRTNNWFEKTNDLDEDSAYLFGCLIGDGGYTVRGRISFTTTDIDLKENVEKIIYKKWGKKFKHGSKPIDYMLCGVSIWDELFEKYGFNSPVCGEKDFPKSVLSAKKNVMAAFVRGLFDTDGFTLKKLLGAGYCSKSKKLVYGLQYVLTKFGIISRVAKRRNTKYNRDYYHLTFFGNDVKIFAKEIGFGIKRKRDILKNNLNKICNTNKDIIPMCLIKDDFLRLVEKLKLTTCYRKIDEFQKRRFNIKSIDQFNLSYTSLNKLMKYFDCLRNEKEYKTIKEIIDKNYFYDKVVKIDDDFGETYDFYIPEDHSFVTNGIISHNSFAIAVYALLRAILIQGSKIVLISASFRQSKTIFNYVNDIYRKSDVLKQISGGEYPKFDISACYFKVGESKITALPLGDGQKIRGERGNCVDGDTIIKTNKGLIRIKDCIDHMQDESFMVYSGNKNNAFQPEYFMKTKPISGYKIKTQYGYELTCSELHGLYTKDGLKEIKDITTEDYLEFDFSEYDFAENKISIDGYEINEDLGWLMGVLLSEGSISNPWSMSVKNTDSSLIEKIKKCWLEINRNFNVCIYKRPACIDKRGWKCKELIEVCVTNKKFRDILEKMGLERKTARDKTIPWSILQSPKSVIVAFLNGLFYGDGSAFLYKDKKRENCFGAAYYTGSEQLSIELQILLSHFGIFSSRCNRKSKISKELQYNLRLYGRNSFKLQDLIKIDKWNDIYNNAAKDINFINKTNMLQIRSIEKLEKKQGFYDFTIPKDHSFVGNCMKNRNCILCDEYDSINPEIFQVVVQGFGVVSLDPIEKVKEKSRILSLKNRGIDFDGGSRSTKNQIIVSGTASYEFKHFAQEYKKYLKIIECKNDREKLREILGPEATDEELKNLDTREFCVIKVPYTHVPILDDSMIAQAKATMTASRFAMEYGAEFYADSEGFIPRSLIEAVSLSHKYVPKLFGEKDKRYIMGVDPARKKDHFSIVIIEVDDSEKRQHKVVYCWATNEKKLKKSGEVNENQTYYGACARKIRQLLSRYNTCLICMDSGGGGYAIADILREKTQLKAGEKQIWEFNNPDHAAYEGEHILRMIDSTPAWSAEANHYLKKAIEDFTLLFPSFDTVEIERDMEKNPEPYSENLASLMKNRIVLSNIDCLETVSEEIENMKDEISYIVVTVTGNGNEHFDLPKIRIPGQQVESDHRRKDRYSACLLANYGIKSIITEDYSINYKMTGGSLNSVERSSNCQMYRGLPARTQYIYTGRSAIVTKRSGGKIVG